MSDQNAFYIARDHEIVDYEPYHIDGLGASLRGPKAPSLDPRQYAVCIGAAQTFGCYCAHPYPAILQQRLDFGMCNLGIAGAGPSFFTGNRALIDLANNASFAVIQVMSGRSESNSLFESRGGERLRRRSDNAEFGADEAYSMLLNGYLERERPPRPVKAIKRIFSIPRKPTVRRIIAETRDNWIENYRSLLREIRVPKILFWFSARSPDYQEAYYGNLYGLFGEFPQLVNQAMVEAIREEADAYVECTTRRGRPHRLVSRFTNQPISIDPAASGHRPDLGKPEPIATDSYYPSPEMHVDAAEALFPVCAEHLHQPATLNEGRSS